MRKMTLQDLADAIGEEVILYDNGTVVIANKGIARIEQLVFVEDPWREMPEPKSRRELCLLKYMPKIKSNATDDTLGSNEDYLNLLMVTRCISKVSEVGFNVPGLLRRFEAVGVRSLEVLVRMPTTRLKVILDGRNRFVEIVKNKLHSLGLHLVDEDGFIPPKVDEIMAEIEKLPGNPLFDQVLSIDICGCEEQHDNEKQQYIKMLKHKKNED